MGANGCFKAVSRAIAIALLVAIVSACSTVPGGSQTASSEGHIRSWADWATAPGDAPSEQALTSHQEGQGN